MKTRKNRMKVVYDKQSTPNDIVYHQVRRDKHSMNTFSCKTKRYYGTQEEFEKEFNVGKLIDGEIVFD